MDGNHDRRGSDAFTRLLRHPRLLDFEKATTTHVEPAKKFETRAEYVTRLRREVFRELPPPPPPETFERTPFGNAEHRTPWWKEHEVDRYPKREP